MPFGDTGILDDFNRSNEGPPPSASWTNDIINYAGNGLAVSSNTVVANAVATCESYWSVETFGPACEAYITIVTIGGNFNEAYTFTRLANIGDGTTDGYALWWQQASTDSFKLFRIDNGVLTQLGSTENVTQSNGDSFGLESNDSDVHTGYYDTGSGWTACTSATATDTTYQSAGYIGLGIEKTTFVCDDFGGGTVGVAGTNIDVPLATVILTGYVPTVVASDHQDIEVPLATLVLTGYVPTIVVSDNQEVDVPLGTLTLTGYTPTIAVSDNVSIDVPAGTLVLTGYAPTITVTTNVNIAVPLGTLILTGYVPTAVVSGGVTIDVPVGVLTLTGYVPTVTVSNNINIDVPLGTLTLTGFAPTVTTTANVNIVVPLGTLVLTGYAPTVTTTANVNIDVPLGTLALTGYAPDVGVGVTVDVPLGALILTGYVPTVTVTSNVLINVPLAMLILTGYAPTITGVEVIVKGLDKPEKKPYEYQKEFLDMEPVARPLDPAFALRQEQQTIMKANAVAESLLRQNEVEAARRVSAMLAREKVDQDKADRRRASSLHNLAKAQIAKEAKAERQAEFNKVRNKSLKKARAAKKRKAKKKK